MVSLYSNALLATFFCDLRLWKLFLRLLFHHHHNYSYYYFYNNDRYYYERHLFFLKENCKSFFSLPVLLFYCFSQFLALLFSVKAFSGRVETESVWLCVEIMQVCFWTLNIMPWRCLKKSLLIDFGKQKTFFFLSRSLVHYCNENGCSCYFEYLVDIIGITRVIASSDDISHIICNCLWH